jgi:hypothetical protein
MSDADSSRLGETDVSDRKRLLLRECRTVLIWLYACFWLFAVITAAYAGILWCLALSLLAYKDIRIENPWCLAEYACILAALVYPIAAVIRRRRVHSSFMGVHMAAYVILIYASYHFEIGNLAIVPGPNRRYVSYNWPFSFE